MPLTREGARATIRLVQDPAEPLLSGDVDPATAGGLIRYRIWPARRHPLRAAFAFVLCLGAGYLTWFALGSWLWAGMVLAGTLAMSAILLLPTEVSLDGHTLNLHQLGTPRTWDLRSFRRIEVAGPRLPRVELCERPRFTPMDAVKAVTVPLPADPLVAEAALMHIRRWVGRMATGRFEIDDDHAPEDVVGGDIGG